MGRQTVLLVTRNLPPLRGGMERLNAHLAQELAARYRVIVVGPRGCSSLAADDIIVYQAPGTSILVFLAWAAATSAWLALRYRPAVILGGSGLVAPVVRLAAWLAAARAAVYLHGLDIIADSSLYRRFWLPSIRGMHACMTNSRHTASLARDAGVDSMTLAVIAPGVDVSRTGTAAGAREFRLTHALADAPLLLSVGRLTVRKGLAEFVANALPAIVARHPSAILVVIGDDAPDAILKGNAGERDRIKALAASLGLASNLRMLGPVPQATLDSAYKASTVHVFPVRDVPGDVEGFGMVAIEAAANGLPTVAFATGGVPDAVATGISGLLVPAGDYPGFVAAVDELLRDGYEGHAASCRQFASAFTWERFGGEARGVLDRLTSVSS